MLWKYIDDDDLQKAACDSMANKSKKNPENTNNTTAMTDEVAFGQFFFDLLAIESQAAFWRSSSSIYFHSNKIFFTIMASSLAGK